ncbi:CorA-like Mg2+ transporter protein [Rhizoctonia solani]|uniref:CorA-like Mg2+ transporter protein n=1 Tax=Rhizoctonia solani TaxID=456999 RepID=A0A8H7IKM8_9AGAM|nr:CorA-like Mg2+ transporter protein [Rhizoctonia solani]
MPKSNSDADENDSLTSDEEGPTRSMTTPHTHANGSTPRPTLAPSVQQPSRINPNDKPIDKFRTAVRLVTKMHRTQVALKDLGFGMGGQDHQGSSLPEMYGHLNSACKVHVWDYGPTKVNPRLFENKYEFIHWLEWVILGCIRSTPPRYDLHPLSLDTVINGRQNARSKADYFPQHLFIHILSHTLTPDNAAKKTAQSAIGSVSYSRPPPTRATTLATTDEPYDDKPEMNMKAIDALKHGTGRVEVDVRSVFMFLLRDGTLITIQRESGWEFGVPIYERLRLRDTLLRSSGDASLLLQSLIDLIVDEAVKITDKYHRRILKMERDILLKPKMNTVRDLHIASGDLTLHKRTMGPISQLVYGLRRYDSDRTKAVTVHNEDSPPPGFLSHQSKVYLADVHDHIEYIISSLDMFSSIAENLINYTFNLVSYETNQVMRGLTVATVIFFPLTFLTGYFGMNFETMDSVKKNSEIMFWEIAFPVMFVVVCAFLYPDVRRFMHFLKKRAATKQFDAKKLQQR